MERVDTQIKDEQLYCHSCLIKISQDKLDQVIKLEDINTEQEGESKNKSVFCCEECLQNEIENEQSEVKKIEENINFLQKRSQEIENDIQEAKNQDQQLEFKDITLNLEKNQKELQKQEEIENMLDKELNELKNDVLQLEKDQSEYRYKINYQQNNFLKLKEKIQKADSYLKKLNSDIQSINQINVLNDTFNIQNDEQVATINNLPIGKKKDQDSIDWDQTNAGLGQICVLFTYLRQKYGYKFQLIDYITCNGNYSQIQPKIQSSIGVNQDGGSRTMKSKDLALYGPVPKQTSEDEFNQAVILLITEFKLFCDSLALDYTITSKQIKVELPHMINNDCITSGSNQYSLDSRSYKQSKWDSWTQAMKYLLTDFKYIIRINADHDCIAEKQYLQEL